MSSKNDSRRYDDEIAEISDAMKMGAVEDISSMVLNSFEPSFKLPQQLEEEEQFLKSVTFDDLLNAGVQRDSGRKGFTLVSRSRSLLQCLESLDGILSGITSGLRVRIQNAQQQVQRLGSMYGLAVAPSEVIVNIFSYAVHGFPSNEPRALISMRLSHVCHRFRNLVLKNPFFWTTINSTPRRPEIGLVESCIQRSKNRPLDIHLYLYTSEVQLYTPAPPDLKMIFPKGIPSTKQNLECDQVLSLLVPHIKRWRSLHLHYVEHKGFSGSTEIFGPAEGSLFPMLETIEEHHYQIDDDGSCRDMSYSTSWNTPALSTLIVSDCLPRSSLSIASIKTFHVQLFSLSDVVEVLDLLKKMQSLVELYIDISRYQYYKITKQNVDDLTAHDPIFLENVKKFTFCFASHHATGEKRGLLERLNVIFSKLQVPNATRVRLEGHKSGFPRCLSPEEIYPLNLHRLVSDLPIRFPNVVNCEISISRDSDAASHFTSFPLHFPLGLEELKFTCNTSLSFPEEDAAEVVRGLSKLRNLTLGLNSRRRTFEAGQWVRWMADYMQLDGEWQSFEKLLLLECEEREDEDAYKCEEIVSRDNVIEWCSQFRGFSVSAVRSQSQGSRWV